MTHTELIARTEHLLLLLKVHQQLASDAHPSRAICRLVRHADQRMLESVREAGLIASLRDPSPVASSIPAFGRVFLEQSA
jgi:hypothetical protein